MSAASLVAPGVVVGLDIGGTATNATVLDGFGRFLIDDLCETPSRVLEGPPATLEALHQAFDAVLAQTGLPPTAVVAVGLDTPGPASADGVISSKGSTNFNQPEWRGFDIRGALETKLGLPVVYTNDANAAALYAHHQHFGAEAERRSSIAAIVNSRPSAIACCSNTVSASSSPASASPRPLIAAARIGRTWARGGSGSRLSQ